MISGSNIHNIAVGEVGQDYEWGEEGLGYVVGPEQTPDPRDTDCSGHVYSVLRKAGARWKDGGPLWRLTADGYKGHVKKISKPSRVGDVGFSVGRTSGKAYHIILYIGGGETTEARGERWGVVRYRLDDPVNGAAKRVQLWGRFDWLDISELEDDDLDTLQDELLKLNRVSNVARSFDLSIIDARDRLDGADEQRLLKEQAKAVEDERKRLGLTKEQAARV